MILFGRAIVLGASLVFAYDVIRVFRRILSHGIVWVSIEDAAYWISSCILVFVLITRENAGEIRVYIFFGMGLGGLLYYFLVGRPFMKSISRSIFRLKKRLKKRCKEDKMNTRER